MKRILISHWVTAGIVLATAVILLGMGRATICECGTIKLFYFQTGTSKGSQHLFDWYSPSHVLHGFIFYAALWLFLRRALAVCAPRADGLAAGDRRIGRSRVGNCR
jgi:hypothetical protein